MPSARRLHVLVLARTYPNIALPTKGIWVERMVRAASAGAKVTVLAPVPYVPPFLRSETFARYRAVPRSVRGEFGTVYHPRVLTGPGQWLNALDAQLLAASIATDAERIHRADPVDLIHAHFIYPDGVVAARLGRRLGIPVMTTEHSHWIPWLTSHPLVRKQVLAAIGHISLVTGVSPSVCDGVQTVSSGKVRVAWMPNVLEDDVFTGPGHGEPVNKHRLLFVGVVRKVKGLDILVRALATLAGRHPSLHLRVIGSPFHRAYQRDEAMVRELVSAMGLSDRVAFVGQATPREVAAAMRESAMLVVPSRRESFSSVTVEALASGIPVVATRCGGPEHILEDGMGRVVRPEDPDALATAIEDLMDKGPAFTRAELRKYAVDRFGLAASSRRIGQLYGELVSPPV